MDNSISREVISGTVIAFEYAANDFDLILPPKNKGDIIAALIVAAKTDNIEVEDIPTFVRNKILNILSSNISLEKMSKYDFWQHHIDFQVELVFNYIINKIPECHEATVKSVVYSQISSARNRIIKGSPLILAKNIMDKCVAVPSSIL